MERELRPLPKIARSFCELPPTLPPTLPLASSGFSPPRAYTLSRVQHRPRTDVLCVSTFWRVRSVPRVCIGVMEPVGPVASRRLAPRYA